MRRGLIFIAALMIAGMAAIVAARDSIERRLLVPGTLPAWLDPVRDVIERDYMIRQTVARVSAMLRDPESAQFRALRLLHRNELAVVCGEVNGRNGFGGLAGFSPFAVVAEDPDRFAYVDLRDDAQAHLYNDYRVLCGLPPAPYPWPRDFSACEGLRGDAYVRCYNARR